MEFDWEQAVAELLRNLVDVQDELLALLSEKRELLVRADLAGMTALRPREESVVEKLQTCHVQRAALLERAAERGLPSDSLRKLVAVLPQHGGLQFRRDIEEAAGRSRLLQHQSLANWMLAQRTLLHLSQMIEIIATGGRMQPTYGKGDAALGSGALVDQAA